jgi:predicted AlkP superfamily phosphohydrolase/phosphomutase
MDAGDPALIHQWVDEGYLPTIAGLMRAGCWGKLTGAEMVCEIGTGASLFSGVSRARHGYYDVRQMKCGTYELELTSPDRAQAVPFWAHLRDTGKRVLVIDPFEINLQPGLDGVQINYWRSHQAAFPVLPPAASSAELLTEVLSQFGPAVRPRDYIRGVSAAEDRQTHKSLLDSVIQKGKLCRHLLERGPFDLAVFGFSEMHVGAHRFWPYRPEATGQSARPGDPVLTHAIRDLYEAIDREFGRLLENVPTDAKVVFVGMFGMKDHFPTMGLGEGICRRLGYQASPPGKSAGWRPRGLARRLLPLPVRRLLGRLVPSSSYERGLVERFRQGTDWSRSTAFALPSLFDTYLRVNLRGREPGGIVEPGKEYREILDRLDADLARFIDPVTNQPAIAKTYRAIELFGEVPDAMPDLIVSWRPHTHFLRRIVHPKGVVTQEEPHYFRDSFHSKGGLLVAAGPMLSARGDVGALAPLDLAPTLLALLGEPVPACMRGNVLTALGGSAAATPRLT